MTRSQTDQIPRYGTVRVGTMAAIPAVIQKFGLDPAEVFADAGLDLKLLDTPDNVITYASRSHLIKTCRDKTGCSHFGLLVGQQGDLSSFGLVGYLVMHSPDLESALHSLIRYFYLHVQGAATILTRMDDMALLSYSIYEPKVEASEQIEDGAVAIAFNILRNLCGKKRQPVEIRFTHHKPKDTAPYHKFFQTPLRFNAEQNGVLFPANWLKQPVHDADPELHRLLKKQIEVLETSNNDYFPDQVRRILHTALITGHSKADDIAALFSMHSRTLNRRLKAYDTSFKDLADEARYGIAQQLLENSELEITQIAAALGYADASAFCRAFRRWSGITPNTWREQSDDKR